MLQKYYQSCFWPAEVNVTKVVLKHIFISLTKNCIVKLEFKNMDCYFPLKHVVSQKELNIALNYLGFYLELYRFVKIV